MQTLALSLDCDGQETLRDRQKLALELVVTLVKLQERFKEEFGKDVALGFEQSASVRKALLIFKTIEEGPAFTEFLSK